MSDEPLTVESAAAELAQRREREEEVTQLEGLEPPSKPAPEKPKVEPEAPEAELPIEREGRPETADFIANSIAHIDQMATREFAHLRTQADVDRLREEDPESYSRFVGLGLMRAELKQRGQAILSQRDEDHSAYLSQQKKLFIKAVPEL